jgi:hypothetical protein
MDGMLEEAFPAAKETTVEKQRQMSRNRMMRRNNIADGGGGLIAILLKLAKRLKRVDLQMSKNHRTIAGRTTAIMAPRSFPPNGGKNIQKGAHRKTPFYLKKTIY